MTASVRPTVAFVNVGHTYAHLFMLLYPTVVLALEGTWGLGYAELLPLGVAGYFPVRHRRAAGRLACRPLEQRAPHGDVFRRHGGGLDSDRPGPGTLDPGAGPHPDRPVRLDLPSGRDRLAGRRRRPSRPSARHQRHLWRGGHLRGSAGRGFAGRSGRLAGRLHRARRRVSLHRCLVRAAADRRQGGDGAARLSSGQEHSRAPARLAAHCSCCWARSCSRASSFR